MEPISVNLSNPTYPIYETMSDYNTLVGSRSHENTNYIGYSDPRFCRPKNVYPYNNPTPLTTPYQTKESSFD